MLLQVAKRQNINVGDREVNMFITQNLAQEKMTLDILKVQVGKLNLHFKDYFNSIKNQIIIGRLRRHVLVNKVYISSKTVQRYIKKYLRRNTMYQLMNIVIPMKEYASRLEMQAVLKKASNIINSIEMKKISFFKAAQRYSQSTNASQGGYFGWKKLSELPQIYINEIKNMKIGMISRPFIANKSIHIIRLQDEKIPSSMKHYLREYNVNIISIKTSPVLSNQSAKAKLMRIKKLVEKGVKFTECLRARDEYNSNRMGWIDTHHVPLAIGKSIRSTPIGKISEPFQIGEQWSIIQVEDKRMISDTQDYQYQKAFNILAQQKAEQVFETWISSMRTFTYIKIFDHRLESSG